PLVARERARGVHHHRRTGYLALFELLEQHQPVHVGQAEVEDHAGVTLAFERREGGVRARHVTRRNRRATEQRDQRLALAHAVFHHQNRLFRLGGPRELL